jgi:ParB-like chromosome segregation protein Spo0J
MAGDQALLNAESVKALVVQYKTVHSKNDKTFLDALKGANEEQLKSLCEITDVESKGTNLSTRKKILEVVKGETEKKSKTKKKAAPKEVTKANKSETEPLFVISTKLSNLVPKMGTEDYERTKASIKEDGLKEPLLVDRETKVLVDGHNRHKILNELGIEITEDMIKYEDIPKEEQDRRVYSANIARRHLTDLEKISLAQKFMPDAIKKLKEEAKEERKAGISKARSNGATDKAEKKSNKKTRQKEADLYGVSEWSVRKMELLQKYTPYLLEKEQEKESPDLEALYNRVKIWYDKVKENRPLLKKVEKNQIALRDAYDEMLERESKKEEKAQGRETRPKKKDLLDRVILVWKEKYEMEDFLFQDLDEYDMEIYKLINAEQINNTK